MESRVLEDNGIVGKTRLCSQHEQSNMGTKSPSDYVVTGI